MFNYFVELFLMKEQYEMTNETLNNITVKQQKLLHL